MCPPFHLPVLLENDFLSKSFYPNFMTKVDILILEKNKSTFLPFVFKLCFFKDLESVFPSDLVILFNI